MDISMAAHIIGFLGMICVVTAFYQTVNGKWSSQGMTFNVVNLCGAILLTISLVVHFNFGSFVIELFWMAISIKGIYGALKKDEFDRSQDPLHSSDAS